MDFRRLDESFREAFEWSIVIHECLQRIKISSEALAKSSEAEVGNQTDLEYRHVLTSNQVDQSMISVWVLRVKKSKRGFLI